MMEIKKGREGVFRGMTIVHDLVAPTLGPNGENVVLDRGFNVPIISNDGVLIAQSVQVPDDTERQGVELMKGMAKKTNEQAGDGTTTSVILAHALISEGMKYENPMEVKRSLEKASIKVVEAIKELAKPVKTHKEILQLATISAESEDIGNMIADIFKVIGNEGVISVEQSQKRETEVQIADGYMVEKGYVNNMMGVADAKDAKILVVGERISTTQELLPFLNKCIAENIRQIVLFCPDMEPGVLNDIALNWEKKIIQVLVIKANTQNQEVLKDIAIITGADYVSRDTGMKLEEVGVTAMGKATKVVIGKTQTKIIGGKGKTKETIEQLKASLPTITDDNEYDMVEKRIARLGKEYALISVGGKTEEAMQYAFYKMEDAVNATKAGIEEGIVEGGGMSLYRISETLGDTVGERILKRALKLPLKKIIENGREDYTEVLVNMPKDKGYNAKTGEYVDLVKAGVIDPAKVERCAVENSVSLASTFLTAHASVSLIRKPSNDAQE